MMTAKYTEEQITNMTEEELNTVAAELIWGLSPSDVNIEAGVFIPSFATEMSAAMELLEAMISKGAEVNIGYYEEWDCSIDYPIGCNWRMTGKTAALAVTRACCLAAAMTGGAGDV